MAAHLQRSRAEIELQNERLCEGLALARDIQLGLLPNGLPGDGRQIAVRARSIPAFEVGGDFYTYIAEVGRDQLGTLPPLQPRQSDHPIALFGQRKVALFFSGPWDIARLKQEAPPEVFAEVGTALLPVARPGAPNGSVQGGGGLFVPKGAAHREAAFEFMKWAVSDRYALRMAKEMGRYPVRTALYDDQYFKSEPLLAPFLEQLKNARPYRR